METIGNVQTNRDAVLNLISLMGRSIKAIQYDWIDKWPVHLRIFIEGKKGRSGIAAHELITELSAKAVLAVVRGAKGPPGLVRYKASLSDVVERKRRLYLDVTIDPTEGSCLYGTSHEDVALLILTSALLVVTETDYGY
jgi:hypothetical protein